MTNDQDNLPDGLADFLAAGDAKVPPRTLDQMLAHRASQRALQKFAEADASACDALIAMLTHTGLRLWRATTGLADKWSFRQEEREAIAVRLGAALARVASPAHLASKGPKVELQPHAEGDVGSAIEEDLVIEPREGEPDDFLTGTVVIELRSASLAAWMQDPVGLLILEVPGAEVPRIPVALTSCSRRQDGALVFEVRGRVPKLHSGRVRVEPEWTVLRLMARESD